MTQRAPAHSPLRESLLEYSRACYPASAIITADYEYPEKLRRSHAYSGENHREGELP
jgi:hypothetical protein